MDCRKCKTEIDQTLNDYFECDSCWSMYHLSCVGVKKGDVAARKSSKFLKLYCDKCYADPGRVMADNIQTLLKYVMKIDMMSQKQVECNKDVEIMLKKLCDAKPGDNNNNIEEVVKEQTESIKGHIDECGKKLHAEMLKRLHTHKNVSENGSNNNEKKSYASVVSGTKSLIVQPKNKENNSEKTKQMLMALVDPTSSGINAIKTLTNGSVLIKCNTNEAVDMIEQQLNETEGENYTVKESNGGAKAKVKIVGMTKKYSNEELTSLIKKQHLNGEGTFVRVNKVYADKNTQKENFNAIVEFDAKTAENVLNAKQISVAWDMCRAYSYVRVIRCYKCLGFNHMAKECKNKIACWKCGGEHKVEDCKSEEMSCINCVDYAKKNNENIDTKHHAFAHNCHCTQQIKNRGMKKKW